MLFRSRHSNRIIATPSAYAKAHYLYVQETGTLQSIEPHISRRDNLASLLFFFVMKGSGVLTYRGREHPLSTGDCVFIDCLEEYSHESSKEDSWELFWVHFYGNDAAHIYRHYSEQDGLFVFHPGDATAFIGALNNIFEQQSAKGPCYEQICHKNLTDIVTACYLESLPIHFIEYNSNKQARGQHRRPCVAKNILLKNKFTKQQIGRAHV